MNIDHYCPIWVFMPHKIRTFSWRFFSSYYVTSFLWLFVPMEAFHEILVIPQASQSHVPENEND